MQIPIGGNGPAFIVGKLAFEPKSSTPEELTAILKTQIEVWTSIARDVGIKPE